VQRLLDLDDEDDNGTVAPSHEYDFDARVEEIEEYDGLTAYSTAVSGDL